MDQQKPLSYESLKTVIQYMDSNFRLVRSCQIASLRKIQKVVPLKLGVLELNDTTFTLDNISYTYQLSRKYIERDGVSVILLSHYDLNADGEEERFQDLMPGDIVIKYGDWQGFLNRDKHFISDSYITFSVQIGSDDPSQFLRSRYGMKLRDAMRKKLNEVLGGKRIHQVEHLKIGVDCGVLRLPEGLKLKVRELSIEKNSMAVIDAILPILDVSSFPLKSLSITLFDPQDPIIQSEILRTSELLNIKNCGYFYNHLANLLINLPNMKIHLKNQIPLNEIFLLVRNWMEHPRIIGTRLSMQSVSMKKYLNEIEKEFQPVIRVVLPERECTMPISRFALPMTLTSELHIYGAESRNHEEDVKIGTKPIKTGMKKLYMVVIEVMQTGTSKTSKDL